MFLTPQEIFDKVATHLLTQKVKSDALDPDHGIRRCIYHRKDGVKCAIGCLIPDEVYDFYLEGKSVLDLPIAVRKAAGVDIDDDKVHVLVWQLQKIHDEFPVDMWPRLLVDLAHRCGLLIDIPKLKEAVCS